MHSQLSLYFVSLVNHKLHISYYIEMQNKNYDSIIYSSIFTHKRLAFYKNKKTDSERDKLELCRRDFIYQFQIII